MAADAALHNRVDAPTPGSSPPVKHEPGGCHGAGSIDFPPPVGIQAQVHPTAGNATSVPNSALRFGTFEPTTPYAQPQGWPAPTQVHPSFPRVPFPQVPPQMQAQAQVPGAPDVSLHAPFGGGTGPPQVHPTITSVDHPHAASAPALLPVSDLSLCLRCGLQQTMAGWPSIISGPPVSPTWPL